jgi:hypothetical protein
MNPKADEHNAALDDHRTAELERAQTPAVRKALREVVQRGHDVIAQAGNYEEFSLGTIAAALEADRVYQATSLYHELAGRLAEWAGRPVSQELEELQFALHRFIEEQGQVPGMEYRLPVAT